MRIYFFAVILAFSFSCQMKGNKESLVRYQDGRQLLTLNNTSLEGNKIGTPVIAKISPDSISIGEELLVKVFIKDAKVNIADAFVNCKLVENPTVDTATYKVSGCSTGLVVQNDTIYIGLRPTEMGLKKFPEITVLTRDTSSVFRTFLYSFEYKVVENRRDK
ncbi:MAG TPA: hypothetical protein VIU12_29245 [Chryseolinea sp.]